MKVQNSSCSIPHKEGKYKDVYMFAYIFPRNNGRLKQKPMRMAAYTGRERLEMEARPL